MYASLFFFAPLGLGALLGPYAGPVVAALLGGIVVFALGMGLYQVLLRHVSGTRAAGMQGEGHNPQLTLTLGSHTAHSTLSAVTPGAQCAPSPPSTTRAAPTPAAIALATRRAPALPQDPASPACLAQQGLGPAERRS